MKFFYARDLSIYPLESMEVMANTTTICQLNNGCIVVTGSKFLRSETTVTLVLNGKYVVNNLTMLLVLIYFILYLICWQ